MNKAFTLTFIIFLSIYSCKKKEVPINVFTVTLDTRPSTNNASNVPIATDTSKKVFLNLSDGVAYSLNTAKANPGKIDVVMYDGTTTSTSVGDVHFLSPGGGTLSIKELPTAYKYLEPGTVNVGVNYFDLTGMNTWSAYNTTKIRDGSSLSGYSVSSFDAMDNLDEFNDALAIARKPGTDNSNQAKKLINTTSNTLTSNLWFFEYQSAGGTKQAFVKVDDFRFQPDGFVQVTIKTPK